MLPRIHFSKTILWDSFLIFVLQHHKVQPKCFKKTESSLRVCFAPAKPALAVRLLLPARSSSSFLAQGRPRGKIKDTFTPVSVRAVLNSHTHQFLLEGTTGILLRFNCGQPGCAVSHCNPTGIQLCFHRRRRCLAGSCTRSLMRRVYTYTARPWSPSSGRCGWFDVPFSTPVC